MLIITYMHGDRYQKKPNWRFLKDVTSRHLKRVRLTAEAVVDHHTFPFSQTDGVGVPTCPPGPIQAARRAIDVAARLPWVVLHIPTLVISSLPSSLPVLSLPSRHYSGIWAKNEGKPPSSADFLTSPAKKGEWAGWVLPFIGLPCRKILPTAKEHLLTAARPEVPASGRPQKRRP